ncbi:MAG TPA: UDP-glucose/GDP-mannose dehydrogenase family protein [Caldimonas sp.]|nr:UDP-glucose/GDP-mannose dehydrogenase family protein [Caldimonas sp.]
MSATTARIPIPVTSSTAHAAPGEAARVQQRIVVIGTGYVGLVTAACLAELGHRVVGVDADAEKVQALERHSIPIHEPGLEALVAAHAKAGTLRFTTELDAALEAAELVFIAVGTPADADGSTDLTAVTAAAADVGARLSAPATVVVKSTVPIGTTERLGKLIAAELRARGIAWRAHVVANPEFLREGRAVHDFLEPDRIVVGAEAPQHALSLLAAYAPLVERGTPVLVMARRSAELAKYAANAMLAARISFMNEMARIAEAGGADIEEVRAGIGSDPRIGSRFLRAGIGWGGSCFPKDVASLAHAARRLGVEPALLDAVESVNEGQKRWAFERLQQLYAAHDGLQGRRIAVWGLAFKPGTDDLREAPSLVLVEQLLAAGAEVAVFDPVAQPAARQRLGNRARLVWARDALHALERAHALVLATEWDEFRAIDPGAIADRLVDGLVLDGRNVLERPRFEAAGLSLWQVGRPRARHAVRAAPPASGDRTAAGTTAAFEPAPVDA